MSKKWEKFWLRVQETNLIRQQIYNINKHQKLQDPLYTLIWEIQNLGGNEDQFIHELK